MKAVKSFFLLAYFLTWIFQIPAVFESYKLITLPFSPLVLILIGSFGPFFAACFLTWYEKGFSAVKRLLQSGFNFRFPLYVYLFIVCVPLIIAFSAYYLTGGGSFNSDFLSLLGTFVLYFFLGGSFNEEFGWRGYALPKLLQNYTPLTATLILGIVWSGWHLPLFWLSGTSQFYTPIWLFFISTTAAAVKFTWVFLRTNGNIFACLLLHTFANITVAVFPIEAVNGVDERVYYETLFEVVLAIIIVAVEFRRFKAKKDF